MLGPGRGVCVDVGCGTGVDAARVAELGWTPIGVDRSAGMPRHAAPRLPVARTDATRLPVPDRSVSAVLAVMVHTDVPAYRPIPDEVGRVLRPGGRFVHIGVHPSFCGGFAGRTDPHAITMRPGYRDGSWTTESWTDQGIRDRVGSTHMPVGELLNAVLDAGFELQHVTEGGEPTPITLPFRARRSGSEPSERRGPSRPRPRHGAPA